jgi:predicted alpha/beta-fold hydrolase
MKLYLSNKNYNYLSIVRSSYDLLPSYEPLAHDVYRDNLTSSPDSKLVIFLHGILGNKRNWRTPCVKWVQRECTHQCVAIDHRGHGSSTLNHFVNGEHTIGHCANDVYHLINGVLDTDPYIICAHSFGGKVALEYLKLLISLEKPLPKHVWILDSLPGIYNKQEEGGQSVNKLFQILSKLPR